MDLKEINPLYHLLHSTNLASDFEKFVEEVLQKVIVELNISIASFWLIDEEEEKYFCIRSYDRASEIFSRGQIISKSQLEKTYLAICETDLISVSDVHIDNGHDKAMDKIMSRNTLSWMSLLDHVDGKLFGFIRVDSDVHKEWKNESVQLLLSAISLINQSFYATNYIAKIGMSGRKHVNVQKSITLLEEKIDEYAFFTVHSIRQPLANMISLMEMMNENDDHKKRRQELAKLIRIEVLKLDEIVRVLISKLEVE